MDTQRSGMALTAPAHDTVGWQPDRLVVSSQTDCRRRWWSYGVYTSYQSLVERERARALPGAQAMAHMQPQHVDPNHPPLSDVIERNIQNQARLRRDAASGRTFQERMADAITAFPAA
jgi:hypothetical protein